MITLPSDVLAIQAGSSYTPLVIVSMGSVVFRTDDPDSGLRFVETLEEGQSFRATIDVQPSDLAAMHPGILRAALGEEVTIKWGYEGSDSMVASPPLKVVSDSGLSEPGTGRITFSCVGWWELLAGSRTVKDPSDASAAPPVWPKDTTVRAIINELLQGLSPVYLDTDDGIVNVYRPHYEADGLESTLTTVRNLLDMTLSYIRIREDGFHIVFPSRTDNITWTYELDGHQFYTRSHTAKISIPNRIVMVPELPTSEYSPDFVGVALDQTSIDKIGFMDMITVDPGVVSLGEANSRAHALMSRLQAESSDGLVIIPMNIGQELYDRVRIIDSRIETTAPMDHFVGMIKRVWTTNQYAMEMGLGGLMSHLSSLITAHPAVPISTPEPPPYFRQRPPIVIPGPPALKPGDAPIWQGAPIPPPAEEMLPWL